MAQTRSHDDYQHFRRELEEAAASWFSRKGIATHPRRSYCLKSKDDWPINIICTDVTEYIKQERERHSGKRSFSLHDLHNGLSSQAMVFNLIGPLVVRRDLEPLHEVAEQAGATWPTGNVTAEFEYCDRRVLDEKDCQPTSFDIAILGETGRVLVEAKLSETEFGGCSSLAKCGCEGRNPLLYGFDTCYLHNRKRNYWELMTEFGFGETKRGSENGCPFVRDYQFFREILFSLTSNGCFVLLHDERNPVFSKGSNKGKTSGLWPSLMESVPAKFTATIGRITTQQLVNAIDESGHHGDWIDEFKSKYGIE